MNQPMRLKVRRHRFEQLESRTLLAGTPLTIITHGFKPSPGLPETPGWVFDMARAINDRLPLSQRCDTSIDADRDGRPDLLEQSVFQPGDDPDNRGCQRFLFPNWNSDAPIESHREEAIDTLVRWLNNRLANSHERLNLHFIGHSRGTVVNSEAIRRLAVSDARIGYLQMTTLDPHPWSLAFDPQPLVGPNVDWADNYYERSGIFPQGSRVSGALNVDLTGIVNWWDPAISGQTNHGEVITWYHWTIDTSDDQMPTYVELREINAETRMQLYDNSAARLRNIDLDGDGLADVFDAGKRIGYAHSLVGGGIGSVIHDSNGDLFTLDLLRSGSTPLYLGRMSRVMYDVAFHPSGQLFAIDSASNLYRITPRFGSDGRPLATANLIGPLGVFANALQFRDDGTLFAAGGDRVYRIDMTTGAATVVARTPAGQQSAGDIEFDASDQLYLTTTSGQLLRLDAALKTWTVVGPTGFSDILGLLSSSGALYGFRNAEEMHQISTADGSTRFVARITNAAVDGVFGAGTLPTSIGPLAQDDTYHLGFPASVLTATASVLANDSDLKDRIFNAVLEAVSERVQLALDGTFTYTPERNFRGIDRFTYRAQVGAASGNLATVTVVSQAGALVQKLYSQVLSRTPEASGWTYWTGQVFLGTTNLGTIASGVFESNERLDPIVSQYYRDYLFREADAQGVAYWRDQVWKRDGGPENVQAGIISSPEFFRSAGGTNTLWATELYRRLLGREPDAEGLEYWTGRLGTNTLSREAVVLGFVKSAENFRSLVQDWFQQYLGRPGDNNAEDHYVRRMQAGASQRNVQIELIDTDEYRNTPPPPAPGTAVPLMPPAPPPPPPRPGGNRLDRYDDFEDGNFDGEVWNRTGAVAEGGGSLKLWMAREGQGAMGIATTDGRGNPGGILGDDIQGFRTIVSRTDRTVLPGQAEAYVGITDGVGSFIRVHWLNDVNDFIIRVGGVYGSGDRARWDGASGVIEVRENAGHVEILFNGAVMETLANRSILADSFFEASVSGGGVDFEYFVALEDLFVYHEV